MKIIYINNTIKCIDKLRKEIDCKSFLEENKLVLLSKYPYINYPNNIQLNKYFDVSRNIMHIALGNLAYIWNGSGMQIQNYGPTFCEQDLIDFPLKYYQEIENRKVDAISFYYSPLYLCPHFSIDRLNNYLNELGIPNNDSLEFQNIDFNYSGNSQIIDSKPRKVIFISAEKILYGANIDMKNIEEVLKKYLNDGNFLVLLSHTGSHQGYPFSINIADISDTISHVDEYREMLNFFNNLDIADDQVSNFKLSYVGINFRGECYNFGFSWSNIVQFFEIYLDYIKRKGYNIGEVHILDHSKNSHVVQSIDIEKSPYIVDLVPTQEDFKQYLKKRILK